MGHRAFWRSWDRLVVGSTTPSPRLPNKRAWPSCVTICRKVRWHSAGWEHSTGLARSVQLLDNASEQFLRDYTWANSTLAKVVLVADDVGPSMRASKVQVVRMQAMTVQAMAKCLFHACDWDAETATRCAQVAMGDWHKLASTVQLVRPAHRLDDSVLASSCNDATCRAEHPSLYVCMPTAC